MIVNCRVICFPFLTVGGFSKSTVMFLNNPKTVLRQLYWYNFDIITETLENEISTIAVVPYFYTFLPFWIKKKTDSDYFSAYQYLLRLTYVLY